MGADLAIFNFSEFDTALTETAGSASTDLASAWIFALGAVRRVMGSADTMAMYRITLPRAEGADSRHLFNANICGRYGVQEELDEIVAHLQSQWVGLGREALPTDVLSKAFLDWFCGAALRL